MSITVITTTDDATQGFLGAFHFHTHTRPIETENECTALRIYIEHILCSTRQTDLIGGSAIASDNFFWAALYNF